MIEVQTLITYIDLKEALEKESCWLVRSTPHTRRSGTYWETCRRSRAKCSPSTAIGTDKNYIRLEELLTKQLLTLDAVDPQGEEGVKPPEQAVKLAQNILSYLDLKSD